MDGLEIVSIKLEWQVYGENYKAFSTPYFRYVESELGRAKAKVIELGNGTQLWVDYTIEYSDGTLLCEQKEVLNTRW